MADDTIFALSSGAPPAAIGVIRVSGAEAGAVVRAVAGRLPAPRRATLAWFRDPATGVRLDRGLLLWFPGPGTATGEDLAEFHIHGGRAVAAAMEEAIARIPHARRAQPGEFTRRAFANGVIDLAQAEGLADLLAAETEAQRRMALDIANGVLSREVERWREALLRAAALVEAALDFSDEDDVVDDLAVPRALAAELHAEIGAAWRRPAVERLRDGIRAVIAGPPNVGKSSLLNALVRREAAITSTVAGTTRDLVEAPVAIAGIPFLLTDTAGLRPTADMVEQIGIDRADAAIRAADLLLWLGEPDAAPQHGTLLRIHPRSDEPGRSALRDGCDLAVSAMTGDGMRQLEEWLLEKASAILPRERETAFNARQRPALEAIVRSLGTIEGEQDAVIVAEHLRDALVSIDAMTGRAGVEEMLDTLFGRFCVGK